MNHFLKYSFSIFCLLACSACDDDGIGVLDIEIPEGYALSAGTSTIFLSSSVIASGAGCAKVAMGITPPEE